MESKYHYFKRDISWLSFNYRVLLEACGYNCLYSFLSSFSVKIVSFLLIIRNNRLVDNMATSPNLPYAFCILCQNLKILSSDRCFLHQPETEDLKI